MALNFAAAMIATLSAGKLTRCRQAGARRFHHTAFALSEIIKIISLVMFVSFLFG
jgi:hypothetical protein